jgi:hypothetical protein
LFVFIFPTLLVYMYVDFFFLLNKLLLDYWRTKKIVEFVFYFCYFFFSYKIFFFSARHGTNWGIEVKLKERVFFKLNSQLIYVFTYIFQVNNVHFVQSNREKKIFIPTNNCVDISYWIWCLPWNFFFRPLFTFKLFKFPVVNTTQ